MANIYHDEDGVLVTELAGMTFPFRFLSGYGVAELVRVCLDQVPLCVLEARGSKGKNIDEDEVLAKNASKFLTPEGLEWARAYRAKVAPIQLLIPEVGPDSEELAVLMAEQQAEIREVSL